MSESKSVFDQYQRGVEYKQRIGYYSDVDENYRYFQGDQWHGVDSKGLPKPIFNVIKPIINYKVSNIKSTDAKIVYKCNNTLSEDLQMLTEVADKLTAYAGQLYEKLKMDNLSERILKESAIVGNGFTYFFYDEGTKEVKAEAIDSTNVYPGNVNLSSIQDQESVIISFRRSVESVKAEAKANGIKDVDFIAGDTDNQELAGDKAKIEVDDNDMCIVLLKFWRDRETGTIWFRKSIKDYDIIKPTNLYMQYYPIAMMTWENQKNCFFGVSDVGTLIPNQDYINTIAAMIMSSTTFTAFPKMVYDENLVDNPSNRVGEAIAVNGGNQAIKNIIDYITPGQISSDAFNMLSTTIVQTKELNGANDGALGNVNPESASGKSIIAVAEQSAIPLESIKQRYYNYLEDVALIWADMWRVYTDDGKTISIPGEDGNVENYEIVADTFNKLMLSVKIDIGATSRYSELAVMQTLDNLLFNQFIPFDWWVELQPDSSGLPKAKLLEFLKKQQQQSVPQQPGFDIDGFLASLPEETRQQAIKNPQLLEQLIAEQMGTVPSQQSAVQDAGLQPQQQPDVDIDSLLDSLPPEKQKEFLENPEMLEQFIAQQMGVES